MVKQSNSIEYLLSLLHLEDLSEKNLPMPSLMNAWLKNKRGSLPDTTCDNIELVLNKHIIPYFGQKQIWFQQLTHFDLEEYYHYKVNSGLNPNTVKHHHSYIRSALDWAWRNNWLIENVAKKAELPKRKKYKSKCWDEAQAKSYLSLFKDDVIEVAILMSLFLGLRRSEVLGTMWSDIDFEHCTIRIQRSVIRAKDQNGKQIYQIRDGLKTDKSERTLHIPELLMKFLRFHRKRQMYFLSNKKEKYCRDHLGFLCVDDYGRLIKPDRLSKRFKMLQIRNGIQDVIRFHELRHTCATLLFAFGCRETDIQNCLGHSTINTTIDIYTHYLQNRKQASAQKFDEYFGDEI